MARSRRDTAAWTLRRVPIFLLLGTLLFQVAKPATARSSADQEDAGARAEVLALDKRRARALVEGDIALLDRITAHDYTHVETTGAARTKSGFLATLRSGEVKFLSFDIDRNEARLFGDVAVLTGSYANRVETSAGVQPVKRARHQRVYVKRDGEWRVVAHQATEMPQAEM